MAIATFIHDGDIIDHTPAANVAAGDVVVQGNLVGVANRDIPAGTLGALAVTGVYLVPKLTGPGSSFDVGAQVYWDGATKKAGATAGPGMTLMGKALTNATMGDTTVKVRLSM